MTDEPVRPYGMLRRLGDETRAINNVVTKRPETVHTFGWYVGIFITHAKERGVTPFLSTDVAAKAWRNGKIIQTAARFDRWMATIAETSGSAFLWLDEIISRRRAARC